MGLYGYPIDEEEFERDKQREIAMIRQEAPEEESCEEENDNNEAKEWQDGQEGLRGGKEGWFLPTPLTTSFTSLEEGKKSVFDRVKDYILCSKPALMEEMRSYLSEETYGFLRKDFLWYECISIFSIVLAVAFLLLFVVLSGNMVVLTLSVASFFGGVVLTNIWHGKYWYYARRSTRGRFSHVVRLPGKKEAEPQTDARDVAPLIEEFVSTAESPPVNRSDIVMFAVLTGLCVLFIFL